MSGVRNEGGACSHFKTLDKNVIFELLRDIIEDSKRFEFVEDEVLRVSSYYNGNKSININFIALIEVMYEKLDDEDIERILLSDEELGDE